MTPRENAPGARGRNHGLNLLYLKGPLGATAAWQRVKNGDGISPASTLAPPGFGNQDTWQLGASYELPYAKLFGQLTHVRTKATSNSSTKMWGFGAWVLLGPGRVLAQYGQADASSVAGESTNRTLSLGYDYDLSKRTDVYAVVMNDRSSGLASGNTYAAGMRLRF